MLEAIKEVEPILMLILGWLFGLLTSPIVERVRRHYRRKDLTHAVVDEMEGLQVTMAFVAYQIRVRQAQVTDDFLDMVLPIFETKRLDPNEHIVENIKSLRMSPEAERAERHKAARKPNSGLTLRQYAVPLFTAQVSDLAICSVDFQRKVLRIRHHLDLYNQIVPQAQSQFDKTFNRPDPDDLRILKANQESAYASAGTQAEIVMSSIGDLRRKYAP
jgi:hypothetical protein